jgi:hypothetical protein
MFEFNEPSFQRYPLDPVADLPTRDTRSSLKRAQFWRLSIIVLTTIFTVIVLVVGVMISLLAVSWFKYEPVVIYIYRDAVSDSRARVCVLANDTRAWDCDENWRTHNYILHDWSSVYSQYYRGVSVLLHGQIAFVEIAITASWRWSRDRREVPALHLVWPRCDGL